MRDVNILLNSERSALLIDDVLFCVDLQPSPTALGEPYSYIIHNICAVKPKVCCQNECRRYSAELECCSSFDLKLAYADFKFEDIYLHGFNEVLNFISPTSTITLKLPLLFQLPVPTCLQYPF